MSTYMDILAVYNPAKYKDIRITGNNTGGALRNMVKALSLLPALNTAEENDRLAAARRLIANKYTPARGDIA
jgi:hypothetical protein